MAVQPVNEFVQSSEHIRRTYFICFPDEPSDTLVLWQKVTPDLAFATTLRGKQSLWGMGVSFISLSWNPRQPALGVIER